MLEDELELDDEPLELEELLDGIGIMPLEDELLELDDAPAVPLDEELELDEELLELDELLLEAPPVSVR